jgi:hypothetical protein
MSLICGDIDCCGRIGFLAIESQANSILLLVLGQLDSNLMTT